MQKSLQFGLFLFIDNLIIAIAGWLFWFLFGKFLSPSDIGFSTILITIATFVSGILLLGFEFPLLKSSYPKEGLEAFSQINVTSSSTFTTIFIYEIVVNILAIPIIFLFFNSYYSSTGPTFLSLILVLLVFTSLSSVSKYGLVGLSKTRDILVIDIFSIGIRIIITIVLLYFKEGPYVILVPLVVQTVLIAGAFTFRYVSSVGIHMGNLRLFSSILKDGISNFPSKISKLMISPLCIILLAAVGISSAEVGTFFICLIITLVVSSFATSLAMTSLSLNENEHVSRYLTLRLGLSLTAPIVAVLLMFPKLLLGLINEGYVHGYPVLQSLSLSILPTIVVFYALSKLNQKGKNDSIILLGLIELGSFLIAFFILVFILDYNTLGASISILIAYTSAAILSTRWLSRGELSYVARVIPATLGAVLLSFVLNSLSSAFLISHMLLTLASVFVINHFSGLLHFSEMRAVVTQFLSSRRVK